MNILDLVGNTPLVELPGCSPSKDVRLFAKLEGQNPTGSVKDRLVSFMIRRAKAEGRLKPGQEIVEATTGNTGISLAMIGRQLGHPVRVVVPRTVFSDVAQTLRSWEAQIEWIEPDKGIASAIAAARDVAIREGAFLLGQFESATNPLCHYEGTGVEILAQKEDVDVFVCGLGTGGTAMGVSRRLKEHNPNLKLVVAEPHPGTQLQGIRSLADGYLPPILDLKQLDAKVLVNSAGAFRAVRELLRRDGIMAGPSSGAVLHAALTYAKRLERGNIVMLFADSGWKYLNSPGFRLDVSLEDESETLDDTVWW